MHPHSKKTINKRHLGHHCGKGRLPKPPLPTSATTTTKSYTNMYLYMSLTLLVILKMYGFEKICTKFLLHTVLLVYAVYVWSAFMFYVFVKKS